MNNKKIGLSLLLVSLISFVSAHVGDSDSEHYSMMGNMMSGHYGYGGLGFGWLIGLLIVAVLVLLIIWLSKNIWKK